MEANFSTNQGGQQMAAAISLLAENFSAELTALHMELHMLRKNMNENNDAFFNCAMALIIFLMQCGFAFLEAGAVRSKNCTNIIIKNVLDSLFGILAYWAIGWGLAFGPNPYQTLDPFFGFSQFFVVGIENYAKFFFQFVFAATASTIISGAVAERAEFACFLTYTVMVTSFCYPILTHWGWTPSGWMARGIAPLSSSGSFRTTYVDFAGSGMVHLCGGTISLIAAALIGPRIGRFPERKLYMNGVGDVKVPRSVEIKGHSVPFASLGGFILMFGFLAFNGGSTGEISSPGVGQTVAKAMVNTILCGSFAALAYMFVHFMRKGKWTLLLTINACLAGMVSACAGCNQMPAWTCMFTGSIAGMVYLAFAELCVAMRVDDPLDAFAVHFGGGLWGLISACLVTEKGLAFALMGGDGHTEEALWQLGWQLVCILAIIGWSALTLTPAFLLLKGIGKMRVPKEVEIRGLDIYKHGEAAYPLTAYGHGWDEEQCMFTLRACETFPRLNENEEVGMEELAIAKAQRKKRAENGNRFSVQPNPQQYEHPEHWEQAKQPNVFNRFNNTIAPSLG